MVEVIISIAILSVVSVVALQLFITSQNLNSSSRHADIASVLGTNYIERIKLNDTIDTMIHDMDGFAVTDKGFRSSTYADEAFDYLPDDSVKEDRRYNFVCQLTKTKDPGLFDIELIVTDLTEQKVLVDYVTAHYFKGEVTADDIN